MSLNLDARQRAMLEEMGVQVWSPKPVAVLVDELLTALRLRGLID